jgi:CDGSH-type Zn-finger protein/uncharacterized Fe-S cluster protein YjdI
MGMSDKVREYADKEIVISYDARRCIHAAECTRGLPAVFDNARRPWIMPSGANADEIAEVITKCPSGALHFTRLDGGEAETSPEDNTIVPNPGGPLCVRGRIQLRSADGSLIVKDTRLTLCRCGKSHNKPFCDNSHRAAGFDDPGSVAESGGPTATKDGLSLTASLNGPLLAEGAFILRGAGGQGQYQATNGELCRCGGSGNKPFCDGTHQRIGFRSEES